MSGVPAPKLRTWVVAFGHSPDSQGTPYLTFPTAAVSDLFSLKIGWLLLPFNETEHKQRCDRLAVNCFKVSPRLALDSYARTLHVNLCQTTIVWYFGQSKSWGASCLRDWLVSSFREPSDFQSFDARRPSLMLSAYSISLPTFYLHFSRGLLFN